jgi:hypothetical protein
MFGLRDTGILDGFVLVQSYPQAVDNPVDDSPQFIHRLWITQKSSRHADFVGKLKKIFRYKTVT